MKVTAPQLPSDLVTAQRPAALFQSEASIVNVVVVDVELHEKNFKSIVLTESMVQKSDFEGSKLESVQLLDVGLESCSFVGTKLSKLSAHRVGWHNSRMSGVQMYESVLENVLFDTCKLDMANFRFSRLKNVCFRHCMLVDADFANATFDQVTFEGCELGETDFSGCQAKSLDLRTSAVVNIKGITSLKGTIVDQVQLVSLAPQFAQEIGLIVRDD